MPKKSTRYHVHDSVYILHTKWESSGPCSFGDEDVFFPLKAMGANDPRGMVGRISQNIKALGLVVSEKKTFFYVLPMTSPGAWPVWTPGAQLAGFIKRTSIHCYIQNGKALGSCGLEEEGFFFLSFSH